MASKILVVDDDAQLAQMIRITLQTRDYEVIVAGNGREALERVRADKPDLVVMDVMMPVMDGFAALRKMKADATIKHIPVILLTARGRSTDAQEGMEAGAHFYLAKPFSTFELIAHVRQILEDAMPVGHESPSPYRGEAISAEARRAESLQTPMPAPVSVPLNREFKQDTPQSPSTEASFAHVLQRLDRIEQLLQVLVLAQTESSRKK